MRCSTHEARLAAVVAEQQLERKEQSCLCAGRDGHLRGRHVLRLCDCAAQCGQA
jgi:hypothetical protein